MKLLRLCAAFLLVFSVGTIKAQELGIQLGVNANSFNLNTELFEVVPLVVDVTDAAEVFGIEETDGIIEISELIDLRSSTDIGYNFGLTYDYDINDQFAVQVAGLISKKGYQAKVDILGALLQGYVDIDLMYIDVPLNLKYKVNLDNDKDLYFSAGPYVSYGFASKETLGVKILGVGGGVDTDLIWGDAVELLERFDYGLVGGLGIDLGQVDLGFQYRFGLANLNPIELEGMELRQQTISMNVGYKF